MDGSTVASLSHDIQLGLGRTDVPDFDRLRELGMASTLAIHLRGLGEIPYDILRLVSDFYFDIPSYALKAILQILAEVEFVNLVSKGDRIQSVIPKVPRFTDVHEGIGQLYSFSELNEHEQGTLILLSQLQSKPENRDRLITTTGIDPALAGRCLKIGEGGSYIRQYRARGRNIVISPIYFSDNLRGLADLTADSGADDIEKLLNMLRLNQGWPLSLIEKRMELNGIKLSENQRQLLVFLCGEGILKPPSIKFGDQQECFVFTPAPGASKLTAEDRDIYERAMALVSCVRKGQLLADRFAIRSPIALLCALRDRGYINSNSEAAAQYRNLVVLRVGALKKVVGNRHQFHLVDRPENHQALELAISLLESGEVTGLRVKQEARIALTKDERYIQSIVSSSDLRKRNPMELQEETREEFEQLLLGV